MDNIITEQVKGVEIKFKTKPGIFARRRLDIGSKFLIEGIIIKDGSIIADLGCGTGAIGFAASKLNPNGHVDLFDVNLRIVQLAKENAKLNSLNNVDVYLSDLFSAVANKTYDQILSNPAQHLGNDFLIESAFECFKHLKSGGEAIWVIQQHLGHFIKRLFNKVFGNQSTLSHNRNYIVIKAQKLTS